MRAGIVQKLSKFVNAKNGALVTQTLGLLHNLSFDERLREEMARNSLIPQLVGHMRNPNLETQVLGLLYHISIEDKNKSMFSYTDALDIIYDRLMGVGDSRTTPELIALAVNLSQNHRNAEVLAQCGRLEALVNHALETEDELLMKIVRNISQQEDQDIKALFRPFLAKFAATVQEPQLTADFALELLGTLGNIALPEFEYEEILGERGLIEFLSEHLVPVETEDDMLLEAVIFIGTVCTEKTAQEILRRIASSSSTSWRRRRTTYVCVCVCVCVQTAFALHKLLLCEAAREELLTKTQVLPYLVDLLNNKNAEVKLTADKALDYVMDVSEQHAPKIRSMKFETFNQEWIQVVAGNAAAAGAADHEKYGHDDLAGAYEYDDEGGDVDYNMGDSGTLEEEAYDHGDYVRNAPDAYTFRRGSVFNAQMQMDLSAYSWQ